MCSSLAEEPLAQAVLSMLSPGESTCPRVGLNSAVVSHTICMPVKAAMP